MTISSATAVCEPHTRNFEASLLLNFSCKILLLNFHVLIEILFSSVLVCFSMISSMIVRLACTGYFKSFFDKISHTFCEKTAIHSLVCLLRSSLLTTCSVIVQTSSTIWQFFFWTEWPEDHKNRCLSSSTNSVGLHFHEGVEKIKENDKNTKIENLHFSIKYMYSQLQ